MKVHIRRAVTHPTRNQPEVNEAKTDSSSRTIGLSSLALPYNYTTGKFLFGGDKPLRTCIHNRGMPDGRGFFSSDKEIFRSHTDVWQGKATPYGGKKALQAAFNGCEYRF